MSSSPKAPIVIVGAGYVGLLTAVGFAREREVRLVDRQKGLIEDLAGGKMPIFEPDLERRFDLVRSNLRFFADLDDALEDGQARLVFIAVGTPKRTASDGDDGANLASVHSVVDTLLRHTGLAAVMKSTVPPGTGREILERARECGSDLEYLSCPEFLQEGKAFKSLDKPDRIVVGRDEPSWASEALFELHAEVHVWLTQRSGKKKYLEMPLTEAELVKHASNLHLAARISYANQIGNLCEELDADVHQVMKGVGADKRIGPNFLEAGVGFGGSCFDKDIRALRAVGEEIGLELMLVPTVLTINEGQIERVIAKLERRLGTLAGAHIAILGLAFKLATDDLRNGPAFSLAKALRKRGATLRAWDPEEGARERALRNHLGKEESSEAMSEDELAGSALEAMQDADAVVLVTAWPEFRRIDWNAAAQTMRGTLVIDGRNDLNPKTVRAAGLEYEGTGRESHGLLRPLLQDAVETR